MCPPYDGAVRYWKRQVQQSRANSKSLVDNYNALHEFRCEVSVLREAIGPTKSLPPDVVVLFNQHAQALAHQGLYATVAKYSMDDPIDRQNQILHDRLYQNRASQRYLAAMGSMAPAFPYTIVAVVVSCGQGLASTVRQQEQEQKLLQ